MTEFEKMASRKRVRFTTILDGRKQTIICMMPELNLLGEDRE